MNKQTTNTQSATDGKATSLANQADSASNLQTTPVAENTPNQSGKVSLGNKIAFACGDIFGGGSFNIINFLYTAFLTLVVGIPMVWVSPILLFTKIWDGIIDPFIGKITDGKTPGKYGKRRYFMLVFAPLVFVGLVLLFFPWNLVVSSTGWKICLVVICYMMYATAQSFVLIPYFSHASEMTDDYTERNKVNAVRLCFSLASSIICVAVPGMIAGPEKGPVSYIIMSVLFGVIFAASSLVTALFSHEQIVTPAVKIRIKLADFVKPLKVKTYRQQLGMQMCSSMSMALMSSFFFILINFYLRASTYQTVTLSDGALSNFPVGTIAAALMFATQIFALPFYLKLIKAKSKRFAYIFAAALWIVVTATMLLLPQETSCTVDGTNVVTADGIPVWLIILYGLMLGFAIGGTNIVVQSSFGDVCDVGELYFGERTEGAFSGLTNFLNTTAQAIGLAIPPFITGKLGFVETQYLTDAEYKALDFQSAYGMGKDCFAIKQINDTWQLLPVQQPNGAKIAILLTFTVAPIVVMALGILIASRYKLDKTMQSKVVSANAMDRTSSEYQTERDQILSEM